MEKSGVQPGWSADDCTSSRADSCGQGRLKGALSITDAHEPTLTDDSVLSNVPHPVPGMLQDVVQDTIPACLMRSQDPLSRCRLLIMV